MTASLVGTSGLAAIPITALNLPLVQRLQPVIGPSEFPEPCVDGPLDARAM
jgi:hypothetical protein